MSLRTSSRRPDFAGPDTSRTGKHFSRLRKLQDHVVEGKAVALLGIDYLDYCVAFGGKYVFHLHGFHDRKRFAHLDLLAFRHVDGDDQPRHRAKQEFRRVRGLLRRHQGRKFGSELTSDRDESTRAAMDQHVAAMLARDLDGVTPTVLDHMHDRVAGTPGDLGAVKFAGYIRGDGAAA